VARSKPVWIVCYTVRRVVVKTCVDKGFFDSEESADLGHRFVLLKEEHGDARFEVARDGWRHLRYNRCSGVPYKQGPTAWESFTFSAEI
jgi:hypothetical protein